MLLSFQPVGKCIFVMLVLISNLVSVSGYNPQKWVIWALCGPRSLLRVQRRPETNMFENLLLYSISLHECVLICWPVLLLVSIWVVSSLGYHESCCCEFSWICLPWTQALTLRGYLPRCGGWTTGGPCSALGTTLSTVVVPAHTPSGEAGQSNWGSSGLLSAANSPHGLIPKMEAPQCTVALSGALSSCPTSTGAVAGRTGRLRIITSGVRG